MTLIPLPHGGYLLNAPTPQRKQAAYMLPEELIDELKHEAVRQRTYASTVVEKACRAYLKQRAPRPGRQPEHASA
jgi:hypothetical protein